LIFSKNIVKLGVVIMMNLLLCLIFWLEEKKLKKDVDFPKEIL